MPVAARQSAASCAACTYRSLRLFCNLDAESLEHLDRIGTRIALPGRAVVFNEHTDANAVYVVCEGQLKLSATSRNGRVMILKLAGPGDILGLSAALSSMPYEVTAETLGPTVLKSVRASDFLTFFHAHTQVSQKTSEVLAEEYRAVFLDARRLALSGSASGRLARLLLDWARSDACGRGELRFTMALTHEDLSSMAGTSRETVTRLLNQYARKKLIARKGSSLVILNPDQLDLLAE